MKSLRKLHTGKPYVQFERRTEASVRTILRASSDPSKDTAGLVENLRGMSDKTVLVVAHSDTLPEIIEKLGAGKIDPIKEDEFDRLFVFHHTGPTSGAVVSLRYCDCP